jgi:hypothetical protein
VHDEPVARRKSGESRHRQTRAANSDRPQREKRTPEDQRRPRSRCATKKSATSVNATATGTTYSSGGMAIHRSSGTCRPPLVREISGRNRHLRLKIRPPGTA